MTIVPARNVEEINRELEHLDPFKRVAWARETFGPEFCMTSSFGAQAAILAHIVSRVDNHIPILFLDTGYHFPETLAYKALLEKEFSLNIITLAPKQTRQEFEGQHGQACVWIMIFAAGSIR